MSFNIWDWLRGISLELEKLAKGVRSFPCPAYTRKEPIGVAGLITLWNGPPAFAAEKLVFALSAGCTAVLKLAEETPFTAIVLGDLCLEAGIPPGVVNVVTGFGEEAGASIAGHPDVDKISFTGSSEVGRLLVRASSDSNLKKLTLELGGKSPNIVFTDADLAMAVPASASAVFANAGQVCSAGTRLFVQDTIYNEVVEGLRSIANGL